MKKIAKLTFNRIIKLLRNLQFSIFLLLTIASTSVLGTLIEQDQNLDFYIKNYSNKKPILGFISYDLILKLGLNHLYTNWWFILLIILFAISLISCTLSIQLPSLKISRKWRFYANDKQYSKMNLKFTIPSRNNSYHTKTFNYNNYYVFQQKKNLYAYKGLLGKVSPILVHASILLILLGVSFGILSGFTIQEMIPIGEQFHLQNIVKSGPISFIPQNFIIKANKFWITYNQDGSIKQFFSDLYIFDNKGNKLIQKEIHVNKPLQFNGITIYQTSWDIFGIRLKINKEFIIQLPLKTITTNQNNKLWITFIDNPNIINDKVFIVVSELKNEIKLYNSNGNLLSNISVNENFSINNKDVYLLEILSSTGLEIKSDPGVPIVYLGFFFIIISTFSSYLSYSQVWIYKTQIGGSTNRASFYFQKEILRMFHHNDET